MVVKQIEISGENYIIEENTQDNVEDNAEHPVPVPGKKVRQKTGSKYNELDM